MSTRSVYSTSRGRNRATSGATVSGQPEEKVASGRSSAASSFVLVDSQVVDSDSFVVLSPPPSEMSFHSRHSNVAENESVSGGTVITTVTVTGRCFAVFCYLRLCIQNFRVQQYQSFALQNQ